jgi:hypothetical protein
MRTTVVASVQHLPGTAPPAAGYDLAAVHGSLFLSILDMIAFSWPREDRHKEDHEAGQDTCGPSQPVINPSIGMVQIDIRYPTILDVLDIVQHHGKHVSRYFSVLDVWPRTIAYQGDI